jgi:hypothetical protein
MPQYQLTRKAAIPWHWYPTQGHARHANRCHRGGMSDKKIIAVVGATGAQVGGLVRELNPQLESLDSWLAEHRAAIAAAI